MPDTDQKHTSDGYQKIQPAKVALSRQAPEAPQSGTQRRGPGPLVWSALGVLFLAAAAVFFILPERVAPVTTETVKTAPGTAQAPASHAPAPASSPQSGASPWSQAQLAQLRKETQDIVAEMLGAQKALKEIGVEAWGEAEYAAALKLAESGDASYGTQAYEAAKSHYRQALEKLQSLLASGETVYAQAIAAGLSAIERGDSTAAATAFSTALLIKPADADALKGSQRAATLDQVRALIAEGDARLAEDRLEEARSAYRKALDLDGEAEVARRQLQHIDQIVTGREFTTAMSAGYAALEAGNDETARQAFARAAKLKPDAAETHSALQDSQQRITSKQISKLLDEAAVQEGNEKWHEAVANYDKALALDPNLLAAQQGRQNAAARAQLDDRLTQAIARPDRLNDQAVHGEASTLLQQAAAVRNPGPGLKRQIVDLDSRLQQAATPVSVELRSDNATEVTLYMVGPLGRFEAKQLSLRPGNYVAVGRRPGYRDVRVEFAVQADKPTLPVTVQCEEKIALGS